MMNKYKHNLIDLDVNKLFVECKIEEIVEIEKLLDAEIERKRTELRSMVGDRYKDILVASDSIKNMKSISVQIVESIQNISASCNTLLKKVESTNDNESVEPDESKINERILVVQVRLAIYINEAIWMCLDKEEYLNAAQLYLLGQNIHTGVNFLTSFHIAKVPLLKHVQLNLASLKQIILERLIKKLESVELTAEQTCSNLNGLMLLQNQNTTQLISIFMDHRKTALSTVINSPHGSVRFQISAMVKCLITTIHLLYDCFMDCDGLKNGLIFKQLEEILSDNSEPTLSKLKLPISPLDAYIPQIIKEFRPKFKIPSQDEQTYSKDKLIERWLEDTKDTVKQGLCKSLELVTNIKGLYIIREEALKVETPSNWESICESVKLPKNFDVWHFFFQSLITQRTEVLIASKIRNNMELLKIDIEDSLINILKSNQNEIDLRKYIWTEDMKDISSINGHPHVGLSMKAMGFSQTIVVLCEKLDHRFRELLNDLSQYLYGIEFDSDVVNVPTWIRNNAPLKKKFVDVDILHKCVMKECVAVNSELITVLKSMLQDNISDEMVKKAIFFIRLLRSIIKLCPYLKKCCSINNVMEDWHKTCNNFNECMVLFWKNWIDYSVDKIKTSCLEHFSDLKYKTMLSMFMRWDNIEIQEQTEEKVFKSQIKVPLKPSIALEEVLVNLNENLCCVLPHTLPKVVHVQFLENNVEVILNHIKELLSHDFNQNQALQLLFDVKYLTILCIKRDNEILNGISQDICDKLRSKIDPFDLDVFYSYLIANVKRATVQSQIILGCLLPSSMQIADLEISERNRLQEKEPSILAVSNPSNLTWFPLLPVTAPSHKYFGVYPKKEEKELPIKPSKRNSPKKKSASGTFAKANASLFGGLTSDWFS